MRNSRVRKTSLEIPALIVYSLSAEERVNSILEMFQKSDVSMVGKDRAFLILKAAINADRTTARIDLAIPAWQEDERGNEKSI